MRRWISVIKPFCVALALYLAAVFVLFADPYTPAQHCDPEYLATRFPCRCLLEHGGEEFCSVPTAPLPSCCLTAHRGSKVKLCHCCSVVYGNKRPISVEERGWYQHDKTEVEFDIR
jgi:hypothetical protein